MRAVIRRSPIPDQLEHRPAERLPEPVEVSGYYIVAEALTNAAKHSCASAITVTVEPDPARGRLHLQVADDGVGRAAFTGMSPFRLPPTVPRPASHLPSRRHRRSPTSVR